MKITKRNEQRLFMCGYVTYVTLLHTRTHAHTHTHTHIKWGKCLFLLITEPSVNRSIILVCA